MSEPVFDPKLEPLVHSVTAKLKNAEQHLRKVMAATQSYAKSTYYDAKTESDRKGRLVARAVNVRKPSTDISTAIGDVAHNYRSALDGLAYLLAASNAGLPLPDSIERTSAFPIFKTGPLFRSKAGRKIQGMSRNARASVERLQPYHKRKNPPLECLWMLEELSNVDKHRGLHITTATPAAVQFKIGGTSQFVFRGWDALIRPIEEGAIIARAYGEFEKPIKLKLEPRFIPQIVFDKKTQAQSVRDLPVEDVLKGIRHVVALEVLPEVARKVPGMRVNVQRK